MILLALLLLQLFLVICGRELCKVTEPILPSSVFQLMTFGKTANCLCTQRRRRVWKLRGSIAKSKYNHSSGLPEVISDAKTKIIERWMAGTDKVWLCLVRTGSSQNIFRFLHQKIIWEGWRTSQPRTFQPRTFQPWIFEPWTFQSHGWKVHDWKVGVEKSEVEMSSL